MIKKFIGNSKVCDLKSLKNLLKNKKFSLVHGVFDVLHVGHKRHFESAKKLTNILVVSLTSDRFVRKGPGRPFFNQLLRTEMVSSFDCVSYVYLNDSETPIDLIKELKPRYYCKGQDYMNFSDDITGNIKKESEAVKKIGGKIHFTTDIQFSSSKLINLNLASPIILKEIKEKYKNLSIFKSQVMENLNKIKNLKVAIFGELIEDEYIYSNNLGQPSKEFIHAVEKVKNDVFIGGSYAIAKNIIDFSKSVDVFSAGDISVNLKKQIKENVKNNIRLFNLDTNFSVVRKSRYLNNNDKKLFECYSYRGKNKKLNLKNSILKLLNKKIAYYDCVIIADFGHGFFSKELFDLIKRKAHFLSINVQTNAGNRGFNLATKYKKSDNILLDLPELQLATGENSNDFKSLTKKLTSTISSRYYTITRGKEGIYIYDKKKNQKISLSAFETKPVDTMGAGDSVLGISSMLLSIGAPLNVVAYLSNLFGAISTSIIGHSSSIENKEILKSVEYGLK
jgi:cytidyltransferase-like protein